MTKYLTKLFASSFDFIYHHNYIYNQMEGLRKYDLTSPMSPFLDCHMVNPLLQFLREVILLFNYIIF